MNGEILIVEDDLGIGRNLERALHAYGYATTWVTSAAGVDALQTSPDLVLLDLGLPDADGVDVARRLCHRWPLTPIVVVTARTDEMDAVMALDAGAVDFVRKPFRLAELVARIRAHSRHVRARDMIEGDLRIDLQARRVYLDDAEISLRVREFDLLVALVSNAGRAMTRSELISQVWDENWSRPTKTLDTHIRALRKHLGDRPGGRSHIDTLRGVGYRWVPGGGDDDGPGDPRSDG